MQRRVFVKSGALALVTILRDDTNRRDRMPLVRAAPDRREPVAQCRSVQVFLLPTGRCAGLMLG